MEPFVFNTSTPVPYFSLSQWEREFSHLVVGFSAKGHLHKDHYNYGLHVGNDRNQVTKNREQLAQEIGMPLFGWTSGQQVHGTSVALVPYNQRGRGAVTQDSAFPQTDGLVTDQVETLLVTYYADCVPLYFYSPDIDLIGTAHAGWKGTAGNIVSNIVHAFVKNGAKPTNMRAAIGPSIGPCCYEVDKKVIVPLKQIISSGSDVQRVMQESAPGHWKLNLKAANKVLLQEAGIMEHHISISSWCTSCHAQYFHSHRRDNGDTGRMAAWIGKRKEL